MPCPPNLRHQCFPLAALCALLLLACPLLRAAHPPAARAAKESGWTGKIDTLLNQPDQQRGMWGVYIYSLDHHRVLYDHEGERLYTPASNTKLFTTAATLALLGPDYRFHTVVQTDTPPEADGVVRGDLVLVGQGDPTLSGRRYPYQYQPGNTLPPFAPDQAIQQLADQIAKRGVKVVDGGIVGDDSYFANEHYAEGWSQDDLVWGYGAAVSALTISDNQRYIEVLPGAAVGQPAVLRMRPNHGSLVIVDRVRTTAPGSKQDIELYRDFGSRRLVVWGTMPAGSAMDLETTAVQHPALWAARLLKRALMQRGIEVLGGVKARHLTPAYLAAAAPAAAPAVPAAPFQLATLESPPLSEALQVIDKVSQNLHAEMMLRLIGKVKGGDGSLAGGSAVRAAFLSQVGLTPHDYYFRDGSGLSRENLVKPQAIVKLLAYMDAQPYAAVWRSFLPEAGVDGSLAKRFRGTPAQGRIFAKTGYVEHVHTLSGYATTLGGEHVAFSIMVNNDDMPESQVFQVMSGICLNMIER